MRESLWKYLPVAVDSLEGFSLRSEHSLRFIMPRFSFFDSSSKDVDDEMFYWRNNETRGWAALAACFRGKLASG
jgi:hypothetical protein